MDILYLPIPLSVPIVLGLLGLFARVLERGRFDDLEREGERIVGDDAADDLRPGGDLAKRRHRSNHALPPSAAALLR